MTSIPPRRALRRALLVATAMAGVATPAWAQTAPSTASDQAAPAAATPNQPQATPQPQVNDPAQRFEAPPATPPAPTSPAPQGVNGTSTLQGAAPTEEPSGTNDVANDVVVTGYRSSLAKSTNAKRNATAFTDTIFAEDIGKFPDTNIAETFNRIPGITITRDITGQGVNVAIRGLGSNFAQVTLNGAPIAVASSGATDAQGTDRAVDLSFFPTDLFTKLTVNKSYTPDLLEGGAAGNIDLRSARPFDRPGTHVSVNAQATKRDAADGWGGRGSLIASTTTDTLGILAGVSVERQESRVTGFESIGWTNPQLTAAQCGATTGCNTTGGGNLTIPSVVPANAGNGLVAGTPIDQAFLLAHNPGLTINQIDNAILPRLGRPSDNFGRRDRVNAVVSAEWRPSDALHLYIDGLYGKRRNDLQRIDMNWVVRSGAVIPLNMTVDKSDCSVGCTVTGGTFANSQFFLEYRPYLEKTQLWGVNPGGEWQVAEHVKVNVQANYTRSTFRRESPSVVVTTPASSGNTVTFANTGGVPTITSSVDLNNPANFGWVGGGRLNIQDEARVNLTKGLRGDVTWGGDRLNLKVGANYDDISRRITAYDNSQAYQNAVCGNNPSAFLPSPNTQPPCNGLNQPGAAPAGYPSYPAYGTGYTAGATGPVTYAGSLVPNGAVPGYLVPGRDGFVTLNFPAFANATNYYGYNASAPSVGAANTGASGGYIREKSPAVYAELNGVAHVADNDLRFNFGLRYVHTDQTIAGMLSVADPRNNAAAGVCPAPNGTRDGSCYPNVTSQSTTKNSYSNWLPALNAAYDIGEHAVARFAVSRTLTRPDPTAQLPGANFSSPSADYATVGNSGLAPYISNNIDVGLEYYTGREGIVSFAAFRKAITGFTQNVITNAPFSALAQYGINAGTVTPQQLAALQARAGGAAVDNVVIQIQQQQNAAGSLHVNGLEFQWVQPLDFLTGRFGVRGFGFLANATVVDQRGSGAAPAVALGVAPYTYTVTGYYEHGGVSVRLADTFNKGTQVSGSNQNGIPAAALFSDDYNQLDLSTIFDLGKLFPNFRNAPQLTFDVQNLNDAQLRTYFQFPNATYTQYRPGRQFLIGVRTSL